MVAIELSDDLLRGQVWRRPTAPTQDNAVRAMDFEHAHDFWVEPALHRFFEHSHHFFDFTRTSGQVAPFVNMVYGIAHGAVTGSVAA